jgi:uncharacterized protein (DUF1015 family)
MAVIKPFKAVRPDGDLVEEVAALPYDVYNSDEAREVVWGNPNSFLRIDRAEVNFDKRMDPHSQGVYEKAAQKLDLMKRKGVLIQEEEESLYIYELTMNGRSQTGLVVCTSIDDYQNNIIKKHELTRADKEKDRINHVDYCDANTGPIFMTYRGTEKIDKTIKTWKTRNEPIYDYVAEDGVGHKVWKIGSKNIIKRLVGDFANVPYLYIADGHHRTASAVKVGMMRREQYPDYTGEEEFNYFLSVLFPAEQLYIMDYNRVVKDLNGMNKQEFLDAISKDFDVVEKGTEPVKPEEKATFGMFMDDKWYLLKAKEETYNAEDPVNSLDVAILQNNLLVPVLGIKDIRTDTRIDFVGGIRGLEELERRSKADMCLGFAMYPTSIDELMNIADADKLMPPKSTWFEPKLRSGIFIHELS